MLKILIQLLGPDTPIFRRYAWMAVTYGLICGLTITTLIPILTHLLQSNIKAAIPWLTLLLIELIISWGWRHQVEQAGVRVGVAILQGARHRIGNHVAHLPIGWFTQENTTRLSHIITQGVMVVAQLPAHIFTPVITGIVTSIVIVIALLSMHWMLGLIALAALPIIACILMFTAQLARYADKTFQKSFAETSQRMVEFAQAQPVLRAFSSEGGGIHFIKLAVENQYQAGVKLIGISALSTLLNAWAVQAVFAILLLAVSLWVNDYLGIAFTTGSITGIIISLLLINRFIETLLEVINYAEVIHGACGQLDAIGELFKVEPLPEPCSPKPPLNSSIELRDVHFRYTPNEPKVLHGLNLYITPGSMVALIGESGSGKTTVAKLIARFFDVSQGSVLIGGVDVRQMSSYQLTSNISQIFQDNYLFTGSIADNIRIGKPTASHTEIMKAAQQAGVTEIIDRLPQGINTSVGEGGARLSGGERQRIAIARALIKNAAILLVDEATAALDTENQALIAETLALLHGKCTLIVIAHQLSTIAMADQIAVLDEGKIVEQGSPEFLRSQQKSHYSHFLAQRQVAKGWRIASVASNRVDF